MAVAELVDAPAAHLLEALDAVRQTPPPLGGTAARLSVLAHAAAELQGVYLRELAAVDPVAEGARNAAEVLADAAGLPAWQARSDAALSQRLAVVPGLLDAVAGGGIELAAARLLAKAWTALPKRLRDVPTAQALITLGQLVDLAQLRAKVDELVAALAPDVTDDALADAREAAELRLVDVGAETRWEGASDVLTGEWVRDVLTAKAEADRGLQDPRTSGARLLDALLDCVRFAVEHGAVPGSPPCAAQPESGAVPPGLVVVTTVDDLERAGEPSAGDPDVDAAVADLFADLPAAPVAPPTRTRPGWSTRSRGGVRLGPRSLGEVSCTAALTRLVTDSRGWPVDSSPLARQLSRRERRALEHRAGYRCERLGCGRPAHATVPHHVVPFALGGSSTLANSVLLCRSCHHLLHDRLRELELTGGRRIGPRGWVRGRPEPP